MGLDMRFSMALYGEAESYACALAWVSKLTYFYSMYLKSEDPEYRYSDVDVDRWEPPQSFTDYYKVMDKKQRIGVSRLLKLRPRSA